jgi:hypothetical protein
MYRVVTWLSLILCFVNISKIYAQEITPTPVYMADSNLGGIPPNSLMWSPDSRTLFFDSQGLETSHFQYDTDISQLSSIDNLPFSFALSSEDQKHFRAWDQQVVLSPNKQNFVYISEFDTYFQFEGYGYWHLFAVGNLESKSFLPLRLAFTGTDFRIRWSDNGSAFVIEEDSVYGGITSVKHVRSRDRCQYLFCAFDEMYVAQIYIPESIFDISPDGQRLLFPTSSSLLMWDSLTNTEASFGESDGTSINRGQIIGAAFIQNDDKHILIVNEDGIGQYNIETAIFQSLNTNVTSTWASWVVFSPDNEKVAVLAGGSGASKKQIFIFPTGLNGFNTELTPQASTGVQ